MGQQVKVGLAIKSFVPQDEPLRYPDIDEYARKAEALGFSSLWAWDHMMLGSKSPFPFLESMSVLAALAARTTRVELGTGVLVLALRNPIVLAKVCTTLDHISGGRFVLGAASGWYEREFESSGIPFERRGRIVERNLAIMRRFWEDDVVDGEAEDVHGNPGALRFRRAAMAPKPIRQPLPVLLGGYVGHVLRRAGAIADGWLSYLYRPDSFYDSWRQVCDHAEAAGRDPAALRNVLQLPICVADSWQEADRRVKEFLPRYFDEPAWSQATFESAIRGTPDNCASQLAEHVAAGVQELVLIPNEYDTEQMEVIAREVVPLLEGETVPAVRGPRS